MAKLNDTFINRVCRYCDNLLFDTIDHKDAFPFDRKTSIYNLYCGSDSGNTVFVRGKVTEIDHCPRLR